MRVLPVHGDCGGFFASVFAKHCDASEVPSDGCQQGRESDRVSSEFQSLRQWDSNMADGIADLFGLAQVRASGSRRPGSPHPKPDSSGEMQAESQDKFPMHRLVVSVAQGKASPVEVRLLSSESFALLCSSQSSISTQLLRVISAGLPIFHLTMEGTCSWWPPSRPWRLCQEGASVVGRYASKRVIRMDDGDFLKLMIAGRMAVGQLLEIHAACRLKGLETCATGCQDASLRQDSLEDGAVVIGRATCGRLAGAMFISGVLTRCELTLLASKDLLLRYCEIIRHSKH